jgi:hypothetical protein
VQQRLPSPGDPDPRYTRDHAAGKSFFLASNVLPHDGKIRTFLADTAPVIELGPDALIMTDPGLILLVRMPHCAMGLLARRLERPGSQKPVQVICASRGEWEVENCFAIVRGE